MYGHNSFEPLKSKPLRLEALRLLNYSWKDLFADYYLRKQSYNEKASQSEKTIHSNCPVITFYSITISTSVPSSKVTITFSTILKNKSISNSSMDFAFFIIIINRLALYPNSKFQIYLYKVNFDITFKIL